MNAAAGAVAEIRLEIILANGQIRVNGPIQDRLLCYGMLELARDVINKFDASQKPGLVEMPGGPIPPDVLRRMRGE